MMKREPTKAEALAAVKRDADQRVEVDIENQLKRPRSFFDRLGPEYAQLTVQSRSGFFDKYVASVHKDKLKQVFLKREFYSLQVLGQFNLGFIISTLNNGRDLFIIDQHASHERCNLERYNKELKVAS